MHRIIFSEPNEAIMAQMQTLKSQFAIITTCCQEVTSSLTKRYKQLCWITPVEDIVSILQVWQNPKLEKWSQVPYRQQNTSNSQIGSETHKKERIFFVRSRFMTNHRQEWLLRFMFDFVNFEKWVEWYGGEAE